MTPAFHGSFTLARPHTADTAAMRVLIDGHDPEVFECPNCFGERGFRTYPSEHSHRTIWTECDYCGGEGTVR
jgi:hypothetical protein